MSSYKERLSEYQQLLEKDEIVIKELKKLCFNGIPDDSGYRPICWRLLLNYLPSRRSLWPSVLKKQRELYAQFVDEMIFEPGHNCNTNTDSSVEDHPLNPNPDSKWMTFFKDNEVLLQIDKDVRRLCPDISFFQQATEFPCKQIVNGSQVEALRKRIAQTALSSSSVASNRKGIITNTELPKRKTANEEYVYLEEGQEAHWEVVERILFIYAKLNPGQSYVQGMNEIIGPLYYTFACDPNPEWKCHAEADCFFCFTHLMSEIRDFFIKSLDDSSTGIGAMMMKLMEMLKKQNYQLWLRFEEQELKPQFYSFRWITLLLSQEFPLPDLIRIWDSLFSDEYRFSFLIYVCCAMLCLLSESLMVGDFPTNMKLLQNFPLADIHKVLAKAVELHK